MIFVQSMTTYGKQHIKVGLLADSQFQTIEPSSFKFNSIMNSKLSDFIVDHAIRPPITSLVSMDSLDYFTERLASFDSDVILFLGDLANNGCKDELETVLKTLSHAREKYSTPIFIALGNHDYLAAGNAPHFSYRQQLCGDTNEFLSKLEAMSMLSEFNYQSSVAYPEFKYQDSLLTPLDDVNPALLCGPKASREDDRLGYEGQHQRPGCLFSGLISHHQSGAAFLMIDSSDYEDDHDGVMANLRFFGAYGAISQRQLHYLHRLIKDEEVSEYGRILFSHYNLNSMKGSQKKFSEYGELFGHASTWLTAHTHNWAGTTYYPERHFGSHKKQKISIHEVNTGSVTDYKMHVNTVYLELSEQSAIPNPSRSQRWETTDDPKFSGPDNLCLRAAKEMSHLNTSHDEYGSFEAIMGRHEGLILFGITKDYRHPHFNPSLEIPKIHRNVHDLLTQHQSHLRDYKVCLSFIASLNEDGRYQNWYRSNLRGNQL